MMQVHLNGKWLAQRLTGTQRYATEIVRAMLGSSNVDFVLHVPRNAEVPDWLQTDRVKIRRAPLNGVLFEQAYLPVATAGRLLLNFAGPAPALKRRQLVTMHDATPFRFPQTFKKVFVRFYFLLYYLLGRTVDHLVTVSHFSARELNDVLGIPVDRFVVAGCAADSLAQVTPVRPDITGIDCPFYLAVGTLANHKNLEGPVAAVANSGRTIVVVGASGNHAVFSDATALTGQAVIAGHVSDAELLWLYRHARALVFPSKYEGFGLPVLEAQSLGCAVVSSNAASLPEVAGEGALFFDPDDAVTLLAALSRIETESGLVENLRDLGLRNASRYSWKRSAETIIDSIRRGQSVVAEPAHDTTPR